MSATMDPYRVLGLEPGASQAEVKRAYRRLAKALHPDAAGEAALPRFLELQDAYELITGTKVRTIRAPGPTSTSAGTAPGGTEGFREPWRADPARARAAREQARTRRAWPGGGAGRASDASAGRPSSGTGGTAGTTARGDPAPGGSGSRTQGSATSGPAAAGEGTAGQGRPTGRRRATRKATLGSTSYDEARDATDRTWAGASWYGPTTGEYWIVNPREYADPRKHGPGYTSRGHVVGDAAPDAEPIAESPREPTGEGPGDPVAPRPRARAAPASSTHGAAPDPVVPASSPVSARAPHLEAAPAWLGGPSADPMRRLGMVLLAWPPLGLVAATLIGQATGCLSYSASCDGTDPLLPWLAQALILGLLLLVSPLTRVLAAGTVAALLGLLPGAAILTALGGAASPAGPPILAGWLVVAWLGGVAWGIRRRARAALAGGDPW